MNTCKVAIIINAMNGGGAEKVCLTLARAINAQGGEASIISLTDRCDYDIPQNLRVYFVSSDKKIRINKQKHQRALARQLEQLCSQAGGFDLHLSNLDSCNKVVAQTTLQNVYYVVHNSPIETLKRAAKMGPIKYFRQKSALNLLDGKNLIAVSKGIENEIIQNKNLTPASLQTIYNPVFVDEIRSLSKRTDSDIPDDDYIIHIGRYARQKRHDILFEAFKALKSEVKLVLLCNNASALKTAVEKAGIADKVIIPGFKQNPYPFIKHARALILSSDFEGFGMCLVEALACNTPVVSTDCPHGPNEILLGEFANYLVPTKSPLSLAKKIDDLLTTTADMKEEPEILKYVSGENIAQRYMSLVKNKSYT